MKIPIPRETSFDCPEGEFKACLVEHAAVPDKQNPGRLMLRLLFEVDTPSTPFKCIKVGRNFKPSLDRGSELKCFLETMLGAGFLDKRGAGGQLDINSLIGTEADIRVVHKHRTGYERPFVQLVEACPLGSLTGRNTHQLEACHI